ncbi:EF hand family protein [Cyclospora cayetanensis]|uniref:EF hand family protein n=1 Tax=Cyclospora cayetanensis TaxID=88456 RepID=A0A1D3D357_9EIME|nr:EF hand family protein [Cyclospora cayetanensis]
MSCPSGILGARATDDLIFSLMAEIEEDCSGQIDFAELLRVFERQAAEGYEEDDEQNMLDVWVALGGSADSLTTPIPFENLLAAFKNNFSMNVDEASNRAEGRESHDRTGYRKMRVWGTLGSKGVGEEYREAQGKSLPWQKVLEVAMYIEGGQHTDRHRCQNRRSTHTISEESMGETRGACPLMAFQGANAILLRTPQEANESCSTRSSALRAGRRAGDVSAFMEPATDAFRLARLALSGAPSFQKGPSCETVSPLCGRRQSASDRQGQEERKAAPWNRAEFLQDLRPKCEACLEALTRHFLTLGNLQLTPAALSHVRVTLGVSEEPGRDHPQPRQPRRHQLKQQKTQQTQPLHAVASIQTLGGAAALLVTPHDATAASAVEAALRAATGDFSGICGAAAESNAGLAVRSPLEALHPLQLGPFVAARTLSHACYHTPPGSLSSGACAVFFAIESEARKAREAAEAAKVAIRAVRREALQHIKQKLDSKAIGENEAKVTEAAVNREADAFVSQVVITLQRKQKALLSPE